MFSAIRDRQIIEVGGFWCSACCEGKPASEQSPDPRYCRGCFEFLKNEAELLPPTKRPGWIPKAEKAHEKAIPVPQDMVSNMSTLDSEKSEVDIINPPTLLRPQAKRGPKHRVLPEDLIRSLAADGMGSKAIVSKLKAEQGIVVSYKTIQRVLSGERAALRWEDAMTNDKGKQRHTQKPEVPKNLGKTIHRIKQGGKDGT